MEYVNTITINDKEFRMGGVSKDEMYCTIEDMASCTSHRIDTLEDKFVELSCGALEMQKAMKKVQQGLEKLRLQFIKSQMDAILVPQVENDPGNFWDEITKNNMFLQNLKD